MKKVFFICTLALSSMHGIAQGADPVDVTINRFRKMGLTAELCFIKIQAENYFITMMNDPTVIDVDKRRLAVAYHAILTDYNSTVAQLMTTLTIKGSKRPFVKLDKARRYRSSVNNAQLQEVSNAIDASETDLKNLLAIKATGGTTRAGLIDFIPSIKDVYDMINGLYANRKAKADALIGILKDLQLRSPSDLLTPPAKEGTGK